MPVCRHSAALGPGRFGTSPAKTGSGSGSRTRAAVADWISMVRMIKYLDCIYIALVHAWGKPIYLCQHVERHFSC